MPDQYQYVAEDDKGNQVGWDGKAWQPIAAAQPSVADAARQRLMAQGLTPEDVKAGRGVYVPGRLKEVEAFYGPETAPHYIEEQAPKEVNGGFLAGAGRAVNPFGLVAPPIGELLRTDQMATPSSEAMMPFDKQTPTLENLPGRLINSIVPHPVDTWRESYRRGAANESRADMYGGVAGSAALMYGPRAAAGLKGAAGALAPDPAVLIDRYIGEGAINEKTGADAGRGVSQAKVVAATAKGVKAGVDTAITKAQTVLNTILQTDRAKRATIDGNKLIADAFGEPPLNAEDATLTEWDQFKGRIIQRISKDTKGTMQLTPKQVHELKNSIDINYGKGKGQFGATETQLETNKKSALVRSTLDHAVDEQLPGYQRINDHLSDLHQASTVLQTKIAQNATREPVSLNPVKLVKGAVTSAFKGGGTPGTRPGALTTPLRTFIASALAESPDIPASALTNEYAPPVPGASEPTYSGLTDTSETVPQGPPAIAAGDSGPAMDLRPDALTQSVGRATDLHSQLLDGYGFQLGDAPGAGPAPGVPPPQSGGGLPPLGRIPTPPPEVLRMLMEIINREQRAAGGANVWLKEQAAIKRAKQQGQ